MPGRPVNSAGSAASTRLSGPKICPPQGAVWSRSGTAHRKSRSTAARLCWLPVPFLPASVFLCVLCGSSSWFSRSRRSRAMSAIPAILFVSFVVEAFGLFLIRAHPRKSAVNGFAFPITRDSGDSSDPFTHSALPALLNPSINSFRAITSTGHSGQLFSQHTIKSHSFGS